MDTVIQSETRRGRIRVSKEFMNSYPGTLDSLARVMESVDIYDKHELPHLGIVEYSGTSSHFDSVVEGEAPPLYRVEISTDIKIPITFTRCRY